MSGHDDTRLAGEVELLAVLDTAPDAVVVADASGTIVAANTHCDRVFGWPPAELVGRKVEVLVPSRSRARHPRTRGGYNHRPMGLLRLPALTREGREFQAEISLAPLRLRGEMLTVATTRDIGDRLALEARAERERDELLATVSHELRTPLASIIGNAELLADTAELAGPQARMLDAIARNAARELRLVEDLLTTAVGNLGTLGLRRRPTRLLELCTAVVGDLRTTARHRGLEIELESGDDADVELSCDPVRIGQVVENLVGNAIKFTEPGGTITVRLARFADSLALRVADTGAGMSPEDAARAFQRFHRGGTALHQQSPGAGLGLAIVQSIVDAHGGRVVLDSVLDEGTTVTVQLPLG